MRRTALARRTPLERTTRLRSSGPATARRRDTGPKRSVRNIVRERFDEKCARCGRLGHSVQHRMPRGAGGTPDPLINRLSNLVWLCGDGTVLCHGVVESRREQAREDGYLIKHGRDVRPWLVPMRLWDGRTVLLDDMGGYAEVTA